MEKIKAFNDFLNEGVDRKFINTFLNDFGFFISLNLSQVTKEGKDTNSNSELTQMMANLRKPLVNGMNYFELTKDLNSLVGNPKLLSIVLGKVREILIYVEPRIDRFVKEGETKTKWLEKIKDLKSRYMNIVSG